MHWDVTATTPMGTSSFQSFHINLQPSNLVTNSVTRSLMSLILIPLLPLSMPYFSLISFEMAFTLVLSRYCFVFSPSVGSPIIFVIRSMLISTGLSIHNIPMCTLANNFLTHPFMCFQCLKCGMSTKFMMSVFYSPRIHCAGSNSGVSDGPSPLLSR
jgi:uncharacterized membrane protein